MPRRSNQAVACSLLLHSVLHAGQAGVDSCFGGFEGFVALVVVLVESVGGFCSSEVLGGLDFLDMGFGVDLEKVGGWKLLGF